MAESDKVIITPTDNGPYHVQGKIRLLTPSGREIEVEDEAWLCRCGGSKNKPFCDGTHSAIGFQAAEAAVAAADAAAGEAGYEDVAGEDDVAEGEIVGVDVAGRAVVIGRVDGEVHAIGGICSHAYARLEDGELDGDIVMCPLHNSGFSIKDGSALRPPAQTPVPTYDVKVENGRILVSRQPRTGNAS